VGRALALGAAIAAAATPAAETFAAGCASDRPDVAFGVDGRLLLDIETTEDLRSDAAHEVRALIDEGFEVAILSGDKQSRVAALASSVGITRAFGDNSPAQKAQFIRDVDRSDTLVIGDGINDGPAISTAFCSGTPAIDRPFLAARSDFYLVGAGLAPIRTALAASRRLHHVLRVGLTVAVAYNVVTVGLAYAGLMTPLLCAVLMPTSSLSTILAVIVSLAGDSWRVSQRVEAT
jgi:Cu2+-exporting ATPase